MNSSVVLFFALVAVASAATIKEESQLRAAVCAKEFSIEHDIVKQLKAKPSEVAVTENLKCFTKCVTDKTELFSKDNVFDIEKLVRIYLAHDHKESDARSGYERCKDLIKLNSTCDEAWSSYKCLNGF